MRFVSDEHAARHRPPQRGLRCVWMEAGLFSYLLCDHAFDCDRCPLDAAMRNHFSSPRKKRERRRSDRPLAPRTGAAACAQHPGEESSAAQTLFTPEHLQVSVRGSGAARISIEPGFAGLLPPVKAVVLPRVGQTFAPGAACCWLVLEGGTLPLRLPVCTTVTTVNHDLEEHPHLAGGADAASGWLFELTTDDAAEFGRVFLGPEAAESKYVADLDAFRTLAAECLHPQGSRRHPTLPDGGRFVDDLSTKIGPVIYFEILRRGFLGPR